jgi:hypothetical protein
MIDGASRCRAIRGFRNLLAEFRLREVRHIQTDHDRRHRGEPPTRGRARVRDSGGVTRASIARFLGLDEAGGLQSANQFTPRHRSITYR